MFFYLLSILSIFQIGLSNKMSFKNFIKRQLLETNFSGDNDVIEILNNIKGSSLQIKKILSLSYLENINLVNSNYNST